MLRNRAACDRDLTGESIELSALCDMRRIKRIGLVLYFLLLNFVVADNSYACCLVTPNIYRFLLIIFVQMLRSPSVICHIWFPVQPSSRQ